MYLSIVIPTYNESDKIIDTLNSLSNHLFDKSFNSEIIVSDDGSSDNTCDQVSEWINQLDNKSDVSVFLIKSSHEGKGSAVKRGILKATGSYRMMFDADLAMPPRYIDGFIDSVEKGYDIVIGSREIKGSQRFDEPYFRHLMGRVFNYYIRLFLVKGYQDTQCGYKCFTQDAVEKLFSKQVINGWGFDVEILFLAGKYGFNVSELPINWYHRNQSKVKPFKSSFEMIKDTLGVKIRYVLGFYQIK
ncbi:MAG: glycosyltransferase [Dehalococcoidia bacterium]